MEAQQMRLFRLEEMKTRLQGLIDKIELDKNCGNEVKIQIPKIKHLL